MLSLAARFADRYNSAWYGLPTDEFREERGRLEDACRAIGRDPASIEISAGLEISDTQDANSPTALAGQTVQMLEGLRAWQAEGVAEVICRMNPSSLGLADGIIHAAQELRAS
jgi:hypothetical protein